MKRSKKLINKQETKKFAKKCYFCSVDDYALLNVHRIIPGESGGKYTEKNSLVVCANCHNRIHDNQIIIDQKYYSTSGKWVLHFWENDQEFWV